MKIVITESQLENYMYEYFDEHLTPRHGWADKKDNEKLLVYGKGEIWFPLDDEDNYIWMFYTNCAKVDSKNQFPKEDCPVLTIPSSIFENLEAYFGNFWKSSFRKWFEKNTGLVVNKLGPQR